MIINKLYTLTAENLLKFVSEEEIYKMYIPDSKFKLNVLFSSPFRDDNKPSFIIGDSSRMYRFKDFATGESGNCFNFVSKLYGIDFNATLIQIANDFNIQANFIINKGEYVPKTFKAEFKNALPSTYHEGGAFLEVRLRNYEQHDYDYWNSYGIDKETLKKSRVYAIKYYFINGHRFLAEKYAYVFVEIKDGIITYKIYQPYSKVRKWINNNNFSVWELWDSLPEEGDVLIITSSRKDAMSITSTTGIPAVSFQAETINPKENVMKQIFSRFKKVFVFYDNDIGKEKNWGQLASEKLIQKYKEFGLINICINDSLNSKDYSDLVFNKGKEFAVNELKKMMYD